MAGTLVPADVQSWAIEYLYIIPRGEGIWHTFGPFNLASTTVSITPLPHAYHPPHTVMTVQDIHVTSESWTTHYFGANVFNSGPTDVIFYWLNVALITPSLAVAAGAPPTTVGEAFPTSEEVGQGGHNPLVTAVHNSEGIIVGLIARPPGAPPAQLEMRPGQRATEIEVPDLPPERGEPRFERLKDLADNYLVEAHGTTGVLRRKAEA
jgi:hypothetical protein